MTYLYHTTSPDAAEAILVEGFLGGHGDVGFGVYFYDNLPDAVAYGRRGGWDGSLATFAVLEAEVPMRMIQPIEPHPEWPDPEAYNNVRYVEMDENDVDQPLRVPTKIVARGGVDPTERSTSLAAAPELAEQIVIRPSDGLVIRVYEDNGGDFWAEARYPDSGSVGGIYALKCNDEDPYASVAQADVHRDFRRQRVYPAMLAALRDFVKVRGCRGIVSYGYQRDDMATRSWSRWRDREPDVVQYDRWGNYYLEGRRKLRAEINFGLMARKRRVSKNASGGDCYEAAVNFMRTECGLSDLDLCSFVLVQGEVQGQGPLAHTTFGHAWVLDPETDTVFDYSNGRQLIMPKPAYYRLGHIDELDNVYEYTWEEAVKQMLRTQVYGPWELVTRSGL
jgi:GNAT superfamily N-acetyltransferase